jgi:predicted GNAT family acetyltransferase
MKPAVADAPDAQRYEAQLEGHLAGVLEYVVKGDRIALIHTEVVPAFEGQGIGAALTRFALDDARRRGLRVLAICPFVKTYLAKHPEDHDIVIGSGPGLARSHHGRAPRRARRVGDAAGQAGRRSHSTQRSPSHQRCQVRPSIPRAKTSSRSGPQLDAATSAASSPPNDSQACQLVPSQ